MGEVKFLGGASKMLPSNVLRKKLSSETTAMSATLAEEIDELNRKIALLGEFKPVIGIR